VSAQPEDLELIEVEALPATLRELVEKIGLPDAYRLCRERGGVRIYIPYQARPDCQLARIVSMEAVRALVEHWQGETIEVPKAETLLRQLRDREIRAARRQGVPRAELARRHNLTIRRIQDIAREPEPDPTGDLFE